MLRSFPPPLLCPCDEWMAKLCLFVSLVDQLVPSLSADVFLEVVLTSSICIFIVGQREEEECGGKKPKNNPHHLVLAPTPLPLRCPFFLPRLLITEAFGGLVSFLTLILPPPPPERQEKNRGKGWLEQSCTEKCLKMEGVTVETLLWVGGFLQFNWYQY